MFFNAHSVLLVITCFHSYTVAKDELMTQFCLNTDTHVHTEGQKNLHNFFLQQIQLNRITQNKPDIQVNP
ncbi:hypothetical protein HF521_020066 [Silurus meridionalis]|uniref:Secreted protein n=1 Tax=Silurus meridionalis TaxID=175797 RepID=A0A8T0BHV1_SILME|nr:hypothetical protein HF521_020066 [Silurus meridionalis]